MADEQRNPGAEPGSMTSGPSSMGGPGHDGRDQASTMVDEARARAEDARDEATERVSDAADAGRERAAEGLHEAASRVRAQDDRLPGQLAGRTAEGMERTASYLRTHDTDEIRGEVERYVREHPIQGVAAAIAAGFLIGRALR